VGPERVRMNEKDKSNETKVSKDGLQVRLLGLGRESALWGAVCVCVCCLTLVDVTGCCAGVQFGKAYVLAGHHGFHSKRRQSHVGLLVL
jgi:hypothetical protein